MSMLSTAEAQVPTNTEGDEPIDSRYFLAPVAGASWLVGIWLASIVERSVSLWLGAAVAAFVAAILLREWLTPLQLIAIACVTAASVGATRSTPAATPSPRTVTRERRLFLSGALLKRVSGGRRTRRSGRGDPNEDAATRVDGFDADL